jgi:hypothetical protein
MFAVKVSSGKDFAGGNGGHGHAGGNANTSTSAHINSSSNSNIGNDYSKKEEFRKYLEKTGVLDALTKTLVGLYEEPERPANAIEYIKRYIGAPQNVDMDGLRRENEQLKAELEKLRAAAAGGVGGGSLKKSNTGSGLGASFSGASNTGTNPKTSSMAHAGGGNKAGNASTVTMNNHNS